MKLLYIAQFYISNVLYSIGSMYGIFPYIYHKNQPNVCKYTIHGSYGYMSIYFVCIFKKHSEMTSQTAKMATTSKVDLS